MNNPFIGLIATAQNSTNEAFELVNKVDSFYNSAWEKLIIFGSISFGIIGIVLPLIIQWYQQKNMKISEQTLKDNYQIQINKIKSEILSSLNTLVDERIQIFEGRINNIDSASKAHSLHLQGDVRINGGSYYLAFTDYIIAANYYNKCDDFTNLQTVLNQILTVCIPKLSFDEISNLKIEHGCDLNEVLDKVSFNDKKGAFTLIIRDIRCAVKKLEMQVSKK